MLHRNDLFDVWRKLNPETKRYTFKRGKSKSRIDYILCSNAVSSKVFGTRINQFSDHDIIITKLKTEDINRGPDVDLGQQITIYRLKPVDGEILIEKTGTVIYVIVRN